MYELFNINNASAEAILLPQTTLINSATYIISAAYTYFKFSHGINILLSGTAH